jgi:hypothetical protein
VAANGQSGKLAVAGATSIAGGSVSVFAAPGAYGPRTRYTILNSPGGVTGAFSGFNASLPSPFLQSSLGYDAQNVYLNLQIGGFAAVAQTPNQYAVGQALDASAPNATGDYATVVSALAQVDASLVPGILTSLSGQNYSGFSNSMVQGAQLFMSNLLSQAGSGNRGSGRIALAEACVVACDATQETWGAWGGALGGLGTVGQGLGTGAVTYNVGGFAAGLDRKLADNFRAGMTVGYTGGSNWVSGFSGQGFSNTVQAGLYGGFAQGPVYRDGIVGYAYSANQLARSIVIPGLAARVATGQTGANQFYGQLEGGYRVDLGGRRIIKKTPFARLQAYTGTQNGFTENGAQSLKPHHRHPDGELAQDRGRRAAGRRDGARLAREAQRPVPAGLEPRVCRHLAAGVGLLRRRTLGALRDLRRVAAARRRRDRPRAQHCHRRGDLGLPALRGRHLRPGFQPRPHRRRAHDVVSPAMKPPWMDEAPVQTLLAALGGAGIAARFVGGCVRDWLLGHRREIDIAVDKPPETVMRALRRPTSRSCRPASGGTVTAIVKGRPFELTTLRRDVETDGRRAVVAFTDDWRTDAGRPGLHLQRALCRPTGTILTISTAAPTFLAGRVRFIGDPDQRIAEDHLRVLRFFRFKPGSAERRSTLRASAPADAMPARSATCRRAGRQGTAAPAGRACAGRRAGGDGRGRRPRSLAAGILRHRTAARLGRARRTLDVPCAVWPPTWLLHGGRPAPETLDPGLAAPAVDAGARCPHHAGNPPRRDLPARHPPVHRPSPARGAGRLACRARRGAALDAAATAGRRRRCAGARPESGTPGGRAARSRRALVDRRRFFCRPRGLPRRTEASRQHDMIRPGLAFALWLAIALFIVLNDAVGDTWIGATLGVRAVEWYKVLVPLPYVVLMAIIHARRTAGPRWFEAALLPALLWPPTTALVDFSTRASSTPTIRRLPRPLRLLVGRALSAAGHRPVRRAADRWRNASAPLAIVRNDEPAVPAIYGGPGFPRSRPARLGRRGHQDRLDIAAGHQAELGARSCSRLNST